MIEIKDGKAAVTISGTYTAEQLRDLLAALGKAHGELTGAFTPDTKLGRFISGGLDVRPAGTLIQFSLLSPCGWVQHGLTHAQADLLIVQVQESKGGASGTVQ